MHDGGLTAGAQQGSDLVHLLILFDMCTFHVEVPGREASQNLLRRTPAVAAETCCQSKGVHKHHLRQNPVYSTRCTGSLATSGLSAGMGSSTGRCSVPRRSAEANTQDTQSWQAAATVWQHNGVHAKWSSAREHERIHGLLRTWAASSGAHVHESAER